MDNAGNPEAARMPSPARRNTRGTARRRRWVTCAIGVAVLAALIAAFWPKPVPVETALVTRGPLATHVVEEGRTRIRNRYVIAAPVSGYLNRVELSAGGEVHAGKTTLATIQAPPSGLLDPRTRAEAEARVEVAEAVRRQRESDLGRARATLQFAQREFARVDVLERQGGVPRREWEDAETRVRVLEKEVVSAEQALQAAQFEVRQARATLTQVSSSEQTGATVVRITAPIDGVVLNVFEENARVLTAGTPIMEIGDTRDLEVEVDLLSSDAASVVPGAEVSIEHWGGAVPLRGRVRLVEPGGFRKVSALGVEEQRVTVHIAIVDSLPPGNTLGDRFRVETRIATWRGEDVLQVPVGALFRRGDDWMVFVVDGGRARLARVETGHEDGAFAEVLSGLAERDCVILYPPDSVTDGIRVSPRPREVR